MTALSPFIVAALLVIAAPGASIITDEDVAAVVDDAKEDGNARETITRLENADGPPLAEAAVGRLWVIESTRTSFTLLSLIRLRRGTSILNEYLTKYEDDPYALLWRGISAIETNYLLTGGGEARADLEKAASLFADAGKPGRRAECYVGLGYLALDFGDLTRARNYWELAAVVAPDSAPAREAARMLNLTQG